MRPVLLTLAFLAAAGAVAFVAVQDGEPTRDDEDLEAGPGRTGARGARMLRTDRAAPVGVYTAGSVPTDPLNLETVMARVVRWPQGTDRLTGEALLDVLAKQVGKDLPVRFQDARALGQFQEAEMDADMPAEAHVAEVFDWVRALGFRVEFKKTFVLFRADREP